MNNKTNKSWQNEIEKPHINVENTDRHFGIADNLVVVVALTATASFAAAFTVPGGFDSCDGSKQGTPFLLKKAAFEAFVIANAIAFSCSCSVLLGHVALLFYHNLYVETSPREQEFIDGKVENMYYLTTSTLLAMTIAFVTGFYDLSKPITYELKIVVPPKSGGERGIAGKHSSAESRGKHS
ncbi:hypothetical protein L1987_58222 [Smallanthus sonchifolius]|uniref:Uncharacterized protein n=1 Tax=Smallanthus sonchifolius TaxID=185202 RepID=A0ACB9DFB4_9ASTR|nr:hypothetical protein L1987_58222 [Smallanthus sonchifolius]